MAKGKNSKGSGSGWADDINGKGAQSAKGRREAYERLIGTTDEYGGTYF